MRELTLIDELLQQVDMALRSVFTPTQRQCARVNPANSLTDTPLNSQDMRHVAGLMRVNHAGEVCAQALYQGQALTAKLPLVKEQMNKAALEEIDHLAWCEERLTELKSRPSVLNPLWYVSSLMIGAFAGLAGDKVSLGFVRETEQQVANHLQKHLTLIPQDDLKTKAILTQMQNDEAEHASMATRAGAITLPLIIQQLMSASSKLLTYCSYYI